MKEQRHGRSRKQQAVDREIIHNLEETRVSDKAVRKFKRKPYECTEVDKSIWERLKSC